MITTSAPLHIYPVDCMRLYCESYWARRNEYASAIKGHERCNREGFKPFPRIGGKTGDR